MKKSLVNYLITIIAVIAIVEGIQLGFYFMSLPDTLFFYIGLTIVAVIGFLVGRYMIKELTKIFTSDEKKSEENDGIKK